MSEAQQGLTVLTYNIHKGFTNFNRRYVISEMREAIRSVHADVVFLQEILGYHPPDYHPVPFIGENQFEFLAESIWPHFTYGKNAVYQEGHHGNAILSKYPVVFWENVNISTNDLERRGLLHVTIQTPFDNEVHLFNVHLDLRGKGRLSQVQQLIDRAGSHVNSNGRLIVAGDFNDWQANLSRFLRESHDLIEVYRSVNGKYARTFPQWQPMLPLDRIYCRGFRVQSAQVLKGPPWSRLSDHLPILARLNLP